ncbi:stalk domain-containing protein [Alkaliphilus serpentinus]|uniref:FMN-binding domain-containing protein n=1 Tax=Alkaliphilus serpentinus TaxID=1482731 RepID=A0A833ME34_9FIRM|nr:stalk domain-containing protein [Alkaliphilus serpentinus]KAB3530227.1 hypothetical protein F8153_07355 [Alkaliphilus serpentinus]
MKKLLAVLLVILMAIPMIAFAADELPTNRPVPNLDPATNYRETPQFTVLFINGENQSLSESLWEGGLAYLPVREVVEKLGLFIKYDAATRSIFVVDSEAAIVTAPAERAAAGSFNLFVNGVMKEVTFEIKDSKSYVSAAELAEALGKYSYEDVRTNSVYYFEADAQMKDGVYTATGLASTNRNRLPKVDITIQDGKITEVVYDEYDIESGLGKSDPAYAYKWDIMLTAIPAFEEDLLAKQNPDLVDVVTTATSSHHKFVELTKKAMAKAMYEATIETTIAGLGGEVVEGYKDGNYRIVGLTDSRGWTSIVDMVIEGGKIVSVNYDSYNAEGANKKNDDGYLTRWITMKADAGIEVDPVAIITEREKQLIDTQDPNLVDVATGATGWGEDLKRFTAGALYHAARADVNFTYADGEYVVKGETDARGYTPEVKLVITNGQISTVEFNDYDAEGLSKRVNPDYLGRWGEKYGIDPLAILQAMEAKIVETQDLSSIDSITGATGWKNSIQELGAKALVDAQEETIYVFIGDATYFSAYYVQLLAIAEGNEVKAIDYVEFQRGNPLAKQHNPSYVGETGRWYTNYKDTSLAGKLPLVVLDEMTNYVMENKTYEIDAVTGATNWGKGYVQLVPRAFEIIENQ